jgi:hypothetical protein
MSDGYKYRPVESSSLLFSMMIGVFLIASLFYTSDSAGALMGFQLPEVARDSVSITYNATFFACGLVFLTWIFSFAENCRALGVRGMRFTPIKAVLWWFIPILNLIVPYRIMQELWRATAPEDPIPTDWEYRPGSRLIMVWWLVYVLGGAAGMLAMYQKGRGEGAGYFVLDLCVGAGDVVSAVFVVLVVRGLTKRQNALARLRGFDPGV